MTAFIFMATLSMAGAQQKPEMTFDQKVTAAREKAIEFLKKQQDPNGHWEQKALQLLQMEGGSTALAVLALLEAGVPVNDPAVTKAVECLARLERKKTYTVSLQTQVLTRVDAKQHTKQIQENTDWLIEKAVRKDGMLMGWSYPANDVADNSNTHFAVVALHAAAQSGAKVDAKIWNQVRELYTRSQTDVGWGYYNDRSFGGQRATSSMTTCALLGLTIAAQYDKKAKGPDPAFDKGMPALFKLPTGGKSDGYERMATAELGRVLGVKTFTAGREKKAWYREGVESLLREQDKDGSFKGKGRAINANPIIATTFALYFLGPPPKVLAPTPVSH